MLASQGYHRKWSLNKYHDVSAAYGKDCISSSLLCSYSFLLLLSIYAIRGFFFISLHSCSQDSNGKALLAQALKNLNWTPLYNMQSCEDMVTCFYNTVTSLLDHHLPLLNVRRHTTDKLWDTDQFRRLIQRRQDAFRSGDKARYRRLRNQVQRLTRQLRRKYFVKKD